MEVLLCYVVIYLIEALIFWLYCNDLFVSRYTVRRTLPNVKRTKRDEKYPDPQHQRASLHHRLIFLRIYKYCICFY